MTTYASPFSIQATTPITRALRTINLRANTVLYWPTGYTGIDYIASINRVVPNVPGLAVTLPRAVLAGLGTALFMFNVGAHAFTVKAADGVVLTTVNPGDAKYLHTISTEREEWAVIGFGAGTSAADASQLQGEGIAAIDGKLNAAHPVSTSASNITISASDRAKVKVASAGSISCMLPAAETVGNNFFFAAHNGGSGTMTIVPSGAETIDGLPSLALSPNESVMVFCSGTSKWYTVGYGRSTQFQFTKLVKNVSAGGTFTLTSAESSNKLLQFVGAPSTEVVVNVPSVVGIYYVQNAYTGSVSLTLKTLNGTGVALNNSDRVIVYCDGTNVVSAQSVSVGTNLSIVDGSIAAPAISFAADGDTGIYRSNINRIGFVAGGVEVATFGSTSYVMTKLGVNNNAPTAFVDIKAGANNEALRLGGTGAFASWYDTAGTGRIAYTTALAGELRETMEGTNLRTFYIGATERMRISASGIVVAGLAEVVNTRHVFLALGNRNSATNLDLSVASTFSATATGAISWTFTNTPPANRDQVVFLKLRNGGAFAQTFPVGTDYPGGTQPVLTASGVDLLSIWYDPELGNYVVGMVYKDYK